MTLPCVADGFSFRKERCVVFFFFVVAGAARSFLVVAVTMAPFVRKLTSAAAGGGGYIFFLWGGVVCAAPQYFSDGEIYLYIYLYIRVGVSQFGGYTGLVTSPIRLFLFGRVVCRKRHRRVLLFCLWACSSFLFTAGGCGVGVVLPTRIS